MGGSHRALLDSFGLSLLKGVVNVPPYRAPTVRWRTKAYAGAFTLLSSQVTMSAANFRSTCGSGRGRTQCRTQRFPTGTTQVGTGTIDDCLGVSSFPLVNDP